MTDTSKTYYINVKTGEIFESREQAMEYYKTGAQIAVYSWSETLQQMVERVRWE